MNGRVHANWVTVGKKIRIVWDFEDEKNLLVEIILKLRSSRLGVEPPNVRVISQMSLDRTGMELNVILTQIIVLVLILIIFVLVLDNDEHIDFLRPKGT